MCNSQRGANDHGSQKHLIDRQRELEKFKELLQDLKASVSKTTVKPKRLVAIVAPPGYGKGVLMAEFAELARRLGVCVIFIDAKTPEGIPNITDLDALIHVLHKKYESSSPEIEPLDPDPFKRLRLVCRRCAARSRWGRDTLPTVAPTVAKLEDLGNPVDEFIKGLGLAAGGRPVLIFIYAYELLLDIDPLIRNDFLAEFPPWAMMVIASRVDLRRADMEPQWITQTEFFNLRPWGGEEIEEYLRMKDIGMLDWGSGILEETGGEPLEVVLAVQRRLLRLEKQETEGVAYSGIDSLDALRAQLRDLLEHLGDAKMSLLGAAVLRQFNVDSLSALMPSRPREEVAREFDEVCQMPFVECTSPQGPCRMHEAARDALQRQMGRQYAVDWRSLNLRAAAYCRELRGERGVDLWLMDESGCQAAFDAVYHELQADESNGLRTLLDLTADLIWNHHLAHCLQLLTVALEAQLSESVASFLQDLKLAMKLYRGAQYADAVKRLKTLSDSPLVDEEPRARQIVEDTWADCERLRSNYAAAADHYQCAVEVFQKLGQPERVAVTQGNLVACLDELGDDYADKGEVLSVNVVQQARETGHPVAIAHAFRIRGEHLQRTKAPGARRVFKKALRAYEDALQAMPAHAESLNGKAQVLAALRRWDDAITVYRQLAEASMEHRFAAWERIGDIHGDHLKDLPKALEAYDMALAAEPGAVGPLLGKALAYERWEHWKEAIQAHLRIAEAAPGYCVALWRRIGDIYREGLNEGEKAREFYEKALSACDSALQEDPTQANALLQRAMVLDGLEQWEDAIEAYEQLVGVVAEQRGAAWQRIAAIWQEKLGDLAAALEAYDEALKAEPGRIGALTGRALVVEAQENWEDAIEAHERVAEASEEHRYAAWRRIGDIYREGLNEGEKAREFYEKVLSGYESTLQAEPAQAEALLQRAMVLDRLERWTDAVEAYQRLAKVPAQTDPQQRLAALFQAGKIALRRLDDPQTALPVFEKVPAEAAEEREGALMEIYRASAALANDRKAKQALRELQGILEQKLAAAATDTSIRRMAWTLFRKGDLAAAGDMCERVAKDETSIDYARAQVILASIAYLRGEPEHAQSLLANTRIPSRYEFDLRWEAVQDLRAVAKQLDLSGALDSFEEWVKEMQPVHALAAG